MAAAARALLCDSVISFRADGAAVAGYRVGGRRPDIAELRKLCISQWLMVSARQQ